MAEIKDNQKTIADLPQWVKFFINRKQLENPQPQFYEIDLTNYCNRKCKWCNAAILRQFPRVNMEEKVFDAILNDAVVNGCGITITGGGESLLHPQFQHFFDKIYTLLQLNLIPNFGCVTNGDMFHHIDYMMPKLMTIQRDGVKAWWVRLSINNNKMTESSIEIIKRYKGLLGQSYVYGDEEERKGCLENIAELGAYSEYPPRLKKNHNFQDCYPEGYPLQCIGRKLHKIHEANGDISYCCNARGMHGKIIEKCPLSCPWGKPNKAYLWSIGPFS